MAAQGDVAIRQRVLVDWGDGLSYSGVVIEVRSEPARALQIRQTAIRVLYDCDQQRLWHTPDEVSPLNKLIKNNV